MIQPRTTRKIAIAANLGALLSPVVLLAAGLYDPPESDGYVCGLYMLLPLAINFLVAGTLTLVGMVAGGLRFWSLPAPRSLAARIEGIANAIPFVVLALFAISFCLLGG